MQGKQITAIVCFQRRYPSAIQLLFGVLGVARMSFLMASVHTYIKLKKYTWTTQMDNNEQSILGVFYVVFLR